MPIWKLNSLASLHWRCWNDEWAVFDVGSGQTHQMNTLAATTVMMFESGPMNLDALCSQVAADLSLPNSAEIETVLEDALAHLVAVGLIESTPE